MKCGTYNCPCMVTYVVCMENCPMSRFTGDMSFFGEAIWWRICYQRGRPRLDKNKPAAQAAGTDPSR